MKSNSNKNKYNSISNNSKEIKEILIIITTIIIRWIRGTITETISITMRATNLIITIIDSIKEQQIRIIGINKEIKDTLTMIIK